MWYLYWVNRVFFVSFLFCYYFCCCCCCCCCCFLLLLLLLFVVFCSTIYGCSVFLYLILMGFLLVKTNNLWWKVWGSHSIIYWRPAFYSFSLSSVTVCGKESIYCFITYWCVMKCLLFKLKHICYFDTQDPCVFSRYN